MMKKLFIASALCSVFMFYFTSCQVNWLDKQYTVPWWVIVIPSVIIMTCSLLLAGKHITSKEYVCSECGERFYPKFLPAMFSVHLNDARVFKCPHCGKKGFCNPVRDHTQS